MIHIHPLVVELRFFDQVDPNVPLQALDQPYRGVAVATIDDIGRARVSGLHCQHFSDDDFKDVQATLKTLGAVEMSYRHHNIEHLVRLT